MGRECSQNGKKIRSGFKILAGRPTPRGKRLLRKPRRGWEDIVRIDPKEIVSIRRIGLILFRIGIIGMHL